MSTGVIHYEFCGCSYTLNMCDLTANIADPPQISQGDNLISDIAHAHLTPDPCEAVHPRVVAEHFLPEARYRQ